jgi:release factor glutamine methyltransferase
VERQQSNKPRSYGEVLQSGEKKLAETSSSARLDAEVLLAHSCNASRTSLITRLRDDCEPEIEHIFHEFIARRQRGEPVAYIVGRREFYGRDFVVSPAVLVPRPESELLIDEALKVCTESAAVTFVDLGTGSGCLAVTLALELAARGKRVTGVAVDVSRAALDTATRNAEQLGAEQYVTFVESDWFSKSDSFAPPYDLIIANPPYIARGETTPVELSFEPSGALYSDDEGLADTKQIISDSTSFLKSGGVLLCEVGAGKRAHLMPLLATLSGFHASILGDDSDQDRFSVIKLVKQ